MMPTLIDLQQIPNQSLSIILEQRRYDIRLVQCAEVMAIDIQRDGNYVVQGMRCFPGTLLFPYEYLEDYSGNFMFTTIDDAFPNYQQIGISQNLWYFTNDELVAARG